MPSYIVKPDPLRDEYVIWSTIVDAPTAVGTRAELEQLLTMHDGPEAAAGERFDRADSAGTSDKAGDYGFDDKRFLYQAWGIGWFWLRRDQLADAVRIQAELGDQAVVDQLNLEPVPEEDE